MPAKKGRKSTRNVVAPPPPTQAATDEILIEVEMEERQSTPPPPELAPVVQKKAKLVRVATAFSDTQKEDIIEFLKTYPSIYEKRRADYKNTQAKDILWQEQATLMKTTVNELKTWYNSQRTKLGRLKQAKKKSGQGAEGFSATDQWVWDNFQFLVPHIVETERRNVVSFKSKLNSDSDPSTHSASPCVLQSSSETDGNTVLNPPLSDPSTLSSPVPEETVSIGAMLKDFLVKKYTASPSADSASYFALYVENTLKQLSGSLRRSCMMLKENLKNKRHNR